MLRRFESVFKDERKNFSKKFFFEFYFTLLRFTLFDRKINGGDFDSFIEKIR